MKKSTLKKYAKLLIKSGLNVQPGQTVYIYASLDQPDFVTLCVEEAYKAKADYVRVFWSHQPITKLSTNKANLKTLCTFDEEEKALFDKRAKLLPCMLYLESDDPDGLKGINQERALKIRQEKYKFIKPYRETMDNKYQWCIAGVPSEKWAMKMFPNYTKKAAINKLWETILYVSRVDEDPIKAWEKHNEELKKRASFLNSLDIDYLHYVSKTSGTDFKVWLSHDIIWEAGSEKALGSNIVYNPNIPSEECFTTPIKGKAEGVVYATKPLSYEGQLIENFHLVFKDGRVCEYHADTNENLLANIVNGDLTSSYLGECALIPFNSPISNSNLLFYSTLYDENASCHLALGAGFTSLLKDYENMSHDEQIQKGVNDSMLHVDFMIGTADMNIVATLKDGKQVQIFKDGEWAF